MTNAQIIFNASMQLLEDGVIKGTGRFYTCKNENGEPVTIEEPEPLHTFAKWKELGRQVKKGEHATAAIMIWKAGKGKAAEEDATADGEQSTSDDIKMFMKKAFFFTLDQTEPITKTE